MDLDPVFTSRLQFGFTIIFHIIFPAFTIGLSAYIATLCVMWMASAKEQYRILAQFWTKIFAVSFAMGVVPALSFPISSAPTGAASASSSAT
jgi:cytochrome bd ubiquinol oxidase subunit I